MGESLFQDYENQKSDAFRKNEKLNSLIHELKELLEPIQRKKEKEFEETKWPVGFITGSPRSGTTLFLQWLAALGSFSYPTNFLTRFAYAPYIGALLQKMLFDPEYDFHEELADIQSSLNFQSHLGKSQGTLATNEFQHFFRNFMPNFDPEYLNEDAIRKVDFEGIKKGLASIEYGLGKTFVTKALMLQFNILDLVKHMPNSLILFIEREPFYNMQSILLAREKYYGDRQIWWSVKPKEYEALKKMDVYHQVAGQVYYTDKSIREALRSLPENKKLFITYEKFCNSPKAYYDKIRDIYKTWGYKMDNKYRGPEKFDITNEVKLDKEEVKKLEEAYNYFTEKPTPEP
ncbi:MAG: sulfotransferase [Bacteroidales bacterium]|nr:sulfotransferase [Bacteroidales bacterium]